MSKKANTLAPREPEQPPVAQPYEVVALHITAEKTAAPVTGRSYYIVLEVERGKLTMYHPFSNTKFTIGKAEFLESKVTNDWNPSPEKLASFMEKKIEQNKRRGSETPPFVKLLAKHYRSQA